MDYVHYNPVKHGYCPRPVDWPYSSFQRYIQQGAYSADWTFDDENKEGKFGE